MEGCKYCEKNKLPIYCKKRLIVVTKFTYPCPFIDKTTGEFHEQKNLEELEKETRSRHISAQVKREVWQRDYGRCVECGSKELLEYDHIIPFSKGGSNTARNIQLLCEKCNRKKHDKI